MPGTDTVDIWVGETPSFGMDSCCRLFQILAGTELGKQMEPSVEDIQQTAAADFESCLDRLEETGKVWRQLMMLVRLGTRLRWSVGNDSAAAEILGRELLVKKAADKYQMFDSKLLKYM